MIRPIRAAADVDGLSEEWAKPPIPIRPTVINFADLMAMDVPAPEMLIEGILPLRGASLLVGAPKSGKTLFGVQAALAVATKTSLLDYYRVLQSGPVMLVEQDDPAATASVKDILRRSVTPASEVPFHLVPKVPFSFGPEFITWLESEICRLSLRLCVLDSYTALRGSRTKGGDIVKAEQQDLTELDALAKRTNSSILIVHHNSKGSASLDWSQQAAGSFAMGAATESQIAISRYADLDSAAPERLLRIRGRHSEDLEVVLRFRKETLNFEHVLQGGAAPLYPLILQLQGTFGAQPFGAKELSHGTGISRATAHRQIDRLYRTGALTKRGYGEYVLAN